MLQLFLFIQGAKWPYLILLLSENSFYFSEVSDLGETMPELTLVDGSGVRRDLPAKLTWQVIVCTVISACGGLMFGYDIGISGTYLN